MRNHRFISFAIIILGLAFAALQIVLPLAQVEAQSAPNPNCDLELSPWTTAAQAPHNHIEAGVAVVNGKLFIFGGFFDSTLNATNRVDVYNPTTNVWETVAKPRRVMPAKMSHIQAVVDGTNVWIAGGFVGNHPAPPTNAVWRYDSVNDQWYSAPPLPALRSAGSLARVGRNIYYSSGVSTNRDTSYPEQWALNLDNVSAGWQRLANQPNPRNHHSGAAVNGVIYAIGGEYNHDHNPVDLNLVHAYNVSTNSWTRVADLPFPRSHFEPGTIAMTDRVVIIGGRANQNGYGNGQLVNVTEYNPTKNAWRELRPLPVKLFSPTAVQIGNKLIVTLGGSSWNTGQRTTYISTISYVNCVLPSATATFSSTPVLTETPVSQPPTDAPTATDTAVTVVRDISQETHTATTVPSSTPTNTTVIPIGTETTVPPTEVPPSATLAPATATSTPLPTSTPTPNLQQVDRLVLINADTDKPISVMTDNYVINCAQIGTKNLNIRANTVPSVVGSVRFSLNSMVNYVIENGGPYAIGRNSGKDFLPWTPPNGQHVLKVAPFTLPDAKGIEGIGITLNFTATNC